jgi:hypothetical protein
MPEIQLRETHIPFLLRQMEGLLGKTAWAAGYRGFEQGVRKRCEILTQIASSKTPNEFSSLRIRIAPDDIEELASSVEVFQAFMAAAMACWSAQGLSRVPTQYFSENAGWVELLDLNENYSRDK